MIDIIDKVQKHIEKNFTQTDYATGKHVLSAEGVDISLLCDLYHTDTELVRSMKLIIEMAIKSGDWKDDGTCDPDLILKRASRRLI